MATRTRVEIRLEHNADEVRELIDFISVGLTDFRPAFRNLEPYLQQSWQRLFESQGASARVSWPTYAQTPESYRYTTVKSRILGRDIWDDDVLRWEPGVRERLYPSLTRRTRDSVRRFGKTEMIRGTRLAYARNHDLGVGYAPPWAWPKRTGRYQNPRRRLMVTDERFARTDAVRVIEDWLRDVSDVGDRFARPTQTGLTRGGVRGSTGDILDGGPSNAF